MSMKQLLEIAGGFTNIIENQDGTCDAIKDGVRYTGLYIKNIEDFNEDSSIITTPVKFSYDKISKL